MTAVLHMLAVCVVTFGATCALVWAADTAYTRWENRP